MSAFVISCHVARMDEVRSVCNVLTDKLTGKSPIGKSRRKWEDNIRNDLKEMGTNTRNSVDSAQNRGYWRGLLKPSLNLRFL